MSKPPHFFGLSALSSALGTSLLAALSLACAATSVHAADPDDVNAWSVTPTQPEKINGATRLRHGLGFSVAGRQTVCDLALLYAAKSGLPMPDDQMRDCALKENALRDGMRHQSTNYLDVFVVRDKVKEFTAILQKRIELLKGINRFYVRADLEKVEPYDFNTHAVRMVTNWGTLYLEVGGKKVQYEFSGPGFGFGPSQLGQQISLDEGQARNFEFARTNGGGINQNNDFYIFEVTGTKVFQDRNQPDRVRNQVAVKFIASSLPYKRADGSETVLSVGE